MLIARLEMTMRCNNCIHVKAFQLSVLVSSPMIRLRKLYDYGTFGGDVRLVLTLPISDDTAIVITIASSLEKSPMLDRASFS
jgi:hypothetical protein